MKFWREVFSDNGIGSFSNVATAVLMLAVIAWDTILVVTKGVIPNLSEQAIFIPVLYTVKKVVNAVSNYQNNK